MHPRSLTVRPRDMMVGRRSFPIGKVTFQNLCQTSGGYDSAKTYLGKWNTNSPAWIFCDIRSPISLPKRYLLGGKSAVFLVPELMIQAISEV